MQQQQRQSTGILLITRSANLIFQLWLVWGGSREEVGGRGVDGVGVPAQVRAGTQRAGHSAACMPVWLPSLTLLYPSTHLVIT